MAELDHGSMEESAPRFQSGPPSSEQHVSKTTTNPDETAVGDTLLISAHTTSLLDVVACLLEDSDESLQVDTDMLKCCCAQIDVETNLRQAISQKRLIAISEETDERTSKEAYYRFPTDEMQQQTYKSIQDPAELNVAIGKRLLNYNNHEGPVKFDEELVVRQFLLGETCFLKEEEKEHARRTVEEEELLARVASLCLSVGQQAIRQSADFEAATTYFNFGIRILQSIPHHWKNEYDLCLHMHCACAEANYSTSNFEYAQTIIDDAMANARCFEDTWGIHATQIYVLGAQAKRQESIALALGVLQQLDEPVMANPKRRDVLWGFVKTRRSLKNKTRERILRLPAMNDPVKLKAMQLMNLILCHAVSVRPALVPFLVFRLVKLTLLHGLSVMSSVAFAHYAMMLSKFGYADESVKYAQLALVLYDTYPVPEWLPRVYLGVYAGVYSCIKNIQRSVEPLKYASRVGLTTGDNEVGFIDAHVSVLNQFTIGENLDVIEKDAERYLNETTKKKLVFLSRRFMVLAQFLHNLRRETPDPASMFGTIMTQTTYEEVCNSDVMFGLVSRFFKLILCYTFGRLEAAAKDCNNLCNELQQNTPSQHGSFTYLYLIDGLVAMARFREEVSNGLKGIMYQQKKQRVIRRVRGRIQYMKRKSLENPDLCGGKLYLLQGELAWLMGNLAEANFRYASALHVSSGANLKFDLAMSHECLARYKLRNKNDATEEQEDASYHFQQAIATYQKWGAYNKALHLKNEVTKLSLHD